MKMASIERLNPRIAMHSTASSQDVQWYVVTILVIADATSMAISTQKSNFWCVYQYLRCAQGKCLNGSRVGFPINGLVFSLLDLARRGIQPDFQRDKLNTKSASPSPDLKTELRSG